MTPIERANAYADKIAGHIPAVENLIKDGYPQQALTLVSPNDAKYIDMLDTMSLSVAFSDEAWPFTAPPTEIMDVNLYLLAQKCKEADEALKFILEHDFYKTSEYKRFMYFLFMANTPIYRKLFSKMLVAVKNAFLYDNFKEFEVFSEILLEQATTIDWKDTGMPRIRRQIKVLVENLKRAVKHKNYIILLSHIEWPIQFTIEQFKPLSDPVHTKLPKEMVRRMGYNKDLPLKGSQENWHIVGCIGFVVCTDLDSGYTLNLTVPHSMINEARELVMNGFIAPGQQEKRLFFATAVRCGFAKRQRDGSIKLAPRLFSADTKTVELKNFRWHLFDD